jgi:mono/diheme cytochrome c family protein
LQFPYSQRKFLWGWQKLFLGPTFESSPEKGPEWNRGAYLAEAFAHCTECHTPRNFLGSLISSQWMGGSDDPVGGRYPPNITPDKINGLGAWSADDWERFLASGRDPQGRFPSAEMAQVIQNTSSLTAADRQALVIYLMSLDPVRRGVDVP